MQKKHVGIAEILLASFGDDKAARKKHIAGDARQINAVARAASHGHLLLTQMLLEAFEDDNKARCEAINKGGHHVEGNQDYPERAAFLVAETRGHREIVILLEKYLKAK